MKKWSTDHSIIFPIIFMSIVFKYSNVYDETELNRYRIEKFTKKFT